MKRLPSLVTLFVVLGLCAQDRNGYVKVAGIEIGGTHLPTQSIVRLLGLTIGQMVNSDTLDTACDRVSRTGLVAGINYSYRPQPDNSGVTVVFRFWDEKPLLPSSVFPPQNETAVWSCLQAADPIFLKELPNTKNALRFYVENINKCISETSDRPLHAEAKVICDAASKPARIEFRIEPGSAN